MRPTLFYIPHELFGIPVFGLGWGLGLIVVVGILFAVAAARKNLLGRFIEEQGVLMAIAACIVVFLLPRIEASFPDGTGAVWIAGLPIRGYGVMLMLGVLSAMAIALYRCKKAGIQQESFFSLATWSIVTGLAGARIFYVVQKWNELDGESLFDKLVTAFKVTEGGLVVYGGVIGGLVAIVLWARRNGQPLLPIADAVTPAFFIGLAFGRVGCLLNGCCYGGLCEQSLPAIQFPSGSPAYMDQMASGKLLGMVTNVGATEDPDRLHRVDRILSGSWAEENGVQLGENLIGIAEKQIDGPSRENPYLPYIFELDVATDQRRIRVAASQMPSSSLPVHPAQIYAALSGIVLCGWTLALAENSKRMGVVFGAGLVAYGVLRIIEEIIRVDEAGQFGTSLSIAQWISLGGILLGIGVLYRVLGVRS
ncbi:MAG: prolipoprotein diacylglyceryl transferase [Pirellula sp.]